MVRSLLLVMAVAGCSENGLVPHPPPVVINVPLKLGQEVVCIESRIRMEMPILFPLIAWARREWVCDLRAKKPVG